MADAAVETTTNDENDDSWLYGESNPDQNEETETPQKNSENDKQRMNTIGETGVSKSSCL